MPEEYESTVTLVDYQGNHQFDSRMVEQLDGDDACRQQPGAVAGVRLSALFAAAKAV